jgi:hypothetical protein
MSQEEIIVLRSAIRQWAFRSIEAVSGPIDGLFSFDTINSIAMFLFLIARKRLVCSLTCESGYPV